VNDRRMLRGNGGEDNKGKEKKKKINDGRMRQEGRGCVKATLAANFDSGGVRGNGPTGTIIIFASCQLQKKKGEKQR